MAPDATEQFLLSCMPVSSNKLPAVEVLKPTKNLVLDKPCISPCFCNCKDLLLTHIIQDISRARGDMQQQQQDEHPAIGFLQPHVCS